VSFLGQPRCITHVIGLAPLPVKAGRRQKRRSSQASAEKKEFTGKLGLANLKGNAEYADKSQDKGAPVKEACGAKQAKNAWNLGCELSRGADESHIAPFFR
jgi:hypothetical protein